MGLSSAVQWWQEWQLRILVLGSLFVHIFLFFAARLRRLPALRRLRLLIWIAYIGGDALAVYALATLFNRHKQRAADARSSSALEVVWAPLLLIHLGGQTSISAYSLEDNELWRRHAITLVSQVTVALYVFCKWWSGEKTLMQATVLLFVIGIIKFSQKPWALKKATFKDMLASSAGAVPIPRGRLGRWTAAIAKRWNRFTTYQVDIIREMFKRRGEGGGGGGGDDDDEKDPSKLEAYVRDAKAQLVQMPQVASDEEELPILFGFLYKMFVDRSVPYSRRLKELRFFLKFEDEDAYVLLQGSLAYTFVLLYTKQRVTDTTLGNWLHWSLPFLALASLVLFAKSHKDGYDDNDVVVTYILFCCTLAQELLYLLPIVWFRGRIFRWHDMVSQYSLMSYCARKEKPTILMKLATVNSLREYVNKHWYVWQVPRARQITKLVHEHVKDGWQKYIRDAASYRGFSNLRGQRTLRRHGLGGWLDGDDGKDTEFGLSLKVPFDKSVLLWHIATDLCVYHPDSICRQGLGPGLGAARRGWWISNYMVYLLFIRPEMLMPGSRPALFTRASDEILGLTGPFDEGESIARRIIELSTARTSPPATDQKSLLRHAWKVFEVLTTRLPDEEERWEVIEGVWVEMLCYSAARSTAYLHARSLGEGGEYLSYVWLLLSFMGMETMADKIHKPEPPPHNEEEETAEIEVEQETAEIEVSSIPA